MNRVVLGLVAAWSILWAAGPALAGNDQPLGLDSAHTIAIMGENDAPMGNDRWNSGDIRISWLSPVLDGLEALHEAAAGYSLWNNPFASRPGFMRSMAVGAGIGIYTPRDLDVRPAPTDDRPYAGLSYLSVAGISQNRLQHDEIELTVGLVGPSSGAKDLQNTIHDTEPRGWDDQLHDEVAFLLAAKRVYRVGPWAMGPAEGFGFELLPRIVAGGGTLAVYGGLGSELRLGWHLPSDFGTPLAQPASNTFGPADENDPRLTGDFSIYLFAAGEGRAVGRNLLLDGNTFEDSRSIDHKTWVADVYGGLGMSWCGARLSLAPALRTKEFEGQPDVQTFISGMLAMTF